MTALITNFKSIKINGEDALTLDFEKATPFEYNMFVGFLLGKIRTFDIFNPSQYCARKEDRFSLLYSSPSGIVTVVPDYYHCLLDAKDVFDLNSIVVVYDYKEHLYYAQKMSVVDKKICIEEQYSDCQMTSKKEIEAGLKSLISYLSIERSDILIRLNNAFNGNFDRDELLYRN